MSQQRNLIILRGSFLVLITILISSVYSQDAGHVPQNAAINSQQAAPLHNQNQLSDDLDTKRLVQLPACRSDIDKYCGKVISQLPKGEILNDITALECLQDAGYTEAEQLNPDCASAIWDFKIEITQDHRFVNALTKFCQAELGRYPKMAECKTENRPGYALSCMMDFVHLLDKSSQCFHFLVRTERVAFSDFSLVAPFVDQCGDAIRQLGCGTLTKPSLHQKARVPHSQGSTLECLIDKLVNVPKDPQKAKIVEGISEDCKKEVSRIAELQSDDYHLDRPLYFACRQDRDQFCADVPAGDGKVFECLMKHKEDKQMAPECSKVLAERAAMMGRDYRLAHPLLKACEKEMPAYRCIPQLGFEKSLRFHLSWVLLCLENGHHWYKQQQHDHNKALEDKNKPPPPPLQLQAFTDGCQHEMLMYRQMMVQEFRMSPELVMTCAQEIHQYCSQTGDLEEQGKTIHCLMEHAQSRDKDKVVSSQCRNALQDLVKVADIGTNYQVDKVLYASCKPLIEGRCKMDMQSEASTLNCLMNNLDGPEMTDDCEQRLIEVQYFMARDWSMDPQLYDACHSEAVQRCHASENWHISAGGGPVNKDGSQNNPQANLVDPGPQVLACLYRAGYDEEHPLGRECTENVRRVLRERAARVNLLPDLEEACRGALSEYCSNNVRPSEEMNCLQNHFEEKDFHRRYPDCQAQVAEFTRMESKDTRLNRLLTRACRPVIETYCEQFSNAQIDHGDVLECLAQHKNSEEMTPKCHSYVNHFELISLRDYHFSYRFTEACQQDIKDNCAHVQDQDKPAIIRCLSNIVFEHRVLGEPRDLRKDCKKQLRTAFLQQEQVEFDDKEHMADAEPELMSKCDRDLKRLNCLSGSHERFEDVVECLRESFNDLDPMCKAAIFDRQKIEAADNTFDDELLNSCKPEIGKFCSSSPHDKVLDCLSNTKIVRLLQPKCQKVVQARLHERNRDDRLNPTFMEACKMEAQQHCPDDYKKLNQAQYAKHQLGPVIAGCLRSKFSQQINPISLGPQCKEELYKLILEAEFDVQLDQALYTACRATIGQHCANDVIGRSGTFDSVLECLRSDFQAGRISSTDCARQIARRTQETLVDIHLDPVLHEACSVDVQRLCRDVPPGHSRIIMCLMDAVKSRPDSVSSSCRTKLTDRDHLWNVAHDKYKLVLPSSWGQAVQLLSEHPQRNSILVWLGFILMGLLAFGCCCGRLSKRASRELKNR